MADEGIMGTEKFQFPLSQVKKQEFLDEVRKPISITLEEIKQEMNHYAKNFPDQFIPHIGENDDIVDNIHNYRRPKPLEEQEKSKNAFDFGSDNKDRNAMIQAVPTLKYKTITRARKELQQLNTSKLIGLVAHLAYWNVFGHLNCLPLDSYHMKQMFISISTIRNQLDLKFMDKKFYHVFLMPMMVLAIRIQIEQIFKNAYPNFFSIEIHEKIAMKLINDLITKLIDPNIYYSRFSFFESGRDAIAIKYEKARSGNSMSQQNKFFRRSALVEQLFPNPSEGKVRALFQTGV